MIVSIEAITDAGTDQGVIEHQEAASRDSLHERQSMREHYNMYGVSSIVKEFVRNHPGVTRVTTGLHDLQSSPHLPNSVTETLSWGHKVVDGVLAVKRVHVSVYPDGAIKVDGNEFAAASSLIPAKELQDRQQALRGITGAIDRAFRNPQIVCIEARRSRSH